MSRQPVGSIRHALSAYESKEPFQSSGAPPNIPLAHTLINAIVVSTHVCGCATHDVLPGSAVLPRVHRQQAARASLATCSADCSHTPPQEKLGPFHDGLPLATKPLAEVDVAEYTWSHVSACTFDCCDVAHRAAGIDFAGYRPLDYVEDQRRTVLLKLLLVCLSHSLYIQPCTVAARSMMLTHAVFSQLEAARRRVAVVLHRYVCCKF